MRGTTIAINGRLYDARTGLPVTAKPHTAHAPADAKNHIANGGQPHAPVTDIGATVNISSAQVQRHAQGAAAATPPPPQSVSQRQRRPKAAHSIHGAPQRSTTLHRAALKRPAPLHHAERQAIKRSPAIQKFAANAASRTAHTAPADAALPTKPAHTAHAVAQAAPTKQVAPQAPPQLKGSALKEKLIADKMAEAMPHQNNHTKTKQPARKRYPRLATIASGIAALVLLAGYLTYLNLPSLSLRVAAGQAGVAATYPSYQPSGYSFVGPVAYSPGEVRVNFKSNTNEFAYSVVQRESNWDSQAVRDNYVMRESKQYTTIQEGGITIYLVNSKAIWANGGVLYSVEGNAPLSGEQIQKIAASTL